MSFTYNSKPFDLKQAYLDAGKSTNTVNTYMSVIRNLSKKIDNTSINYLIDNAKSICETIKKEYNLNTSKTILSAITVLLDNIDKDKANVYRECMMVKIKESKDNNIEQKLSDKQKENWIDWEDVLDIQKKLESIGKNLLKQPNLSKKEIEQIQNWIILSLYTKIPPRRILDFIQLRWNPTKDKDIDNYIDFKKKKIIFNDYKTASTYGTEEVELPSDLSKILKAWNKVNNNEFVLINGKNEQLGRSELIQRLNKIFNKNISASMLRHSYLSHYYKNMPKLKEMTKLAKDMGHSVSMALEYVKDLD